MHIIDKTNILVNDVSTNQISDEISQMPHSNTSLDNGRFSNRKQSFLTMHAFVYNPNAPKGVCKPGYRKTPMPHHHFAYNNARLLTLCYATNMRATSPKKKSSKQSL